MTASRLPFHRGGTAPLQVPPGWRQSCRRNHSESNRAAGEWGLSHYRAEPGRHRVMAPASVRIPGASRAWTSFREPGVHQRARRHPAYRPDHHGRVRDDRHHRDEVQSHLGLQVRRRHRDRHDVRRDRRHRGDHHGQARRGAGQLSVRASCPGWDADHRDGDRRRHRRQGGSRHRVVLRMCEACPGWLRTGYYRDGDRRHPKIRDDASHLGLPRDPFPG